MAKLFIYIFCVFAFPFFFATNHCSAQVVSEESFLQNRITFILRDTDEELLLRVLSRRANIPIGFYQLHGVGEEGKRKVITVDIKMGTVSSVLDTFVNEDPRYKWSYIDGVINIVPKIQETLLNTSIKTVDLSDIKLDDAEFAILSLPEVKAALADRGVSATKVAIKYGAVKEHPAFSLTMEQTTLRSILNEILRSGYGDYWTIEQYGSNFEYISLSFS